MCEQECYNAHKMSVIRLGQLLSTEPSIQNFCPTAAERNTQAEKLYINHSAKCPGSSLHTSLWLSNIMPVEMQIT